jgi:predicted dehydrogenase
VIDLAAGFVAVAGALDRVGVRFVVVGSMAAAHWGVARTTRDIDLVIVIDVDRAPAVLAALDRDDLYVPVDAARTALSLGGSFNVLHAASGGKVDVFVVAPDDDFESVRLARRARAEVLGIETWVATAEDVILAKLRWRLESRCEVQWRDCVEIAAVTDLDHEHLRRWAPRLGVDADLADLLEAADPPD